MTVQQIIDSLFGPKGLTYVTPGKGIEVNRVKSAQGAAIRSKIQWADVLAAMTPDQRQQIDDHS